MKGCQLNKILLMTVTDEEGLQHVDQELEAKITPFGSDRFQSIFLLSTMNHLLFYFVLQEDLKIAYAQGVESSPFCTFSVIVYFLVYQ